MRNLMITLMLMGMAVAAAAAASTAAAAEQFDGKRPLLCSAFRIFECELATGCLPVTAAELGVASSWTLDFKKKEFTATTPDARPNTIDRVELLDGKLFLSGVQDGLPDQLDGVGWSVSITNPDGVMTMMIAGERVGVVGLGSCVTR